MIKNFSNSSMTGEEITACVKIANEIFMKAQETVVYRPSVAYVLQHIKSFVTAIQPLKNRSLSPTEIRAIERFSSLLTHFSTNILPKLGSEWVANVLNWSTTHVHEYIEGFRKHIIEFCQQLNLDAEKVLKFDATQDAVNKMADLQHLRKCLEEFRNKSLSHDNAVDIQQIIQTRLDSLQNKMPERNHFSGLNHVPTTEAGSVTQIVEKMESALSQFKAIDIPDSDLKMGGQLGTGGFGAVYSATRISTGEILAVKQVRSDRLSVTTWASLYSELATMASLQHRYVLELVGTHIKEPYRIITRFCPGRSLFDRLHRCTSHTLSDNMLTHLAYQVALGMNFLHENGIVHRDLKTMNILLDETDSARIADFGLCGSVRDNKELVGMLGTPHYTAPEVLDRKRYGLKVDSYSYGIVLWEMFTREVPFRDKSHKEICDYVVNRNLRLPLPKETPDGLRRLIIRCWSSNPTDRPTFKEIIDLFNKNEVYFGTEPVDLKKNEDNADYKPLDKDYIIYVLNNPSNPNFASVIDFFEKYASKKVVQRVRDSRVMDKYIRTNPNIDRILILASVLLLEAEYPTFLTRIGLDIIQKILSSKNANHIAAVAKFMLKVPTQHLGLIETHIQSVVCFLSEQPCTGLILRLLASGGKERISKFSGNLVKYFRSTFHPIDDQETLDALNRIIPVIINDIKDPSVFVPLLEGKLIIPEKFCEILVKYCKNKDMNFYKSIFSAASRSDLDEPVKILANLTNMTYWESLFEDDEFLLKIEYMLRTRKTIVGSLLFIYNICINVESAAKNLANHNLIAEVLDLEGYISQRLQIFTSLCLKSVFLQNTTYMDLILKLLSESMGNPQLSGYTMRLIAAFSISKEGCQIIKDSHILSWFSDIFLSAGMSRSSVPLTILKNVSNASLSVPRISLIISCLMQDLLSDGPARSAILNTLIAILAVEPDKCLETDLQNIVLPLLSPGQYPTILVLVLRLFCVCDISKLRLLHPYITKNIFKILSQPENLYPELIEACVQLVVALSFQYDVTGFISGSQFDKFLSGIQGSLSDEYSDIRDEIVNLIPIISNMAGASPVSGLDSVPLGNVSDCPPNE